MATMGERIKEQLIEKGISQKELAIKAGTTEAAISCYVRGTRVPRASVLAKIAIALNTTTEYLMEGIPADAREELDYAKKLIARNAEQMTRKEKMELIDILLGDEDV